MVRQENLDFPKKFIKTLSLTSTPLLLYYRRMKQIIRRVLDEWRDRQPNMASETCRELLADDLHNALHPYLENIIEEIVTGAINNEE